VPPLPPVSYAYERDGAEVTSDGSWKTVPQTSGRNRKRSVADDSRVRRTAGDIDDAERNRSLSSVSAKLWSEFVIQVGLYVGSSSVQFRPVIAPVG